MIFMTSLILVLILLVFIIIGGKIYVKLSAGRCKSNVCLIGKTALVTGGNAGMGYQTALALAGRGARVIIADRDNAEKSKEQIIRSTHNPNIVTKYVDYTKLSTVRELAKDINETEERLDILVNNAGAGGLGNVATKDGIHVGMQVNHFASFLLTNLLSDILKRSAPSRIVFVSSEIAYYHNLTANNINPPSEVLPNERTFLSEFYIYANSKLCNIITSNEFARRLQEYGVISHSVHPGLVNTKIFERSRFQKYITNFIYLYLNYISKNAEEGAQTAIHVAIANSVQCLTGQYWKDCAVCPLPPKAKDRKFCKKIWDVSAELVNLTPEETVR